MVVIRKAEPSDRAILVEIGVHAWTQHIFSYEPETAGMRARARRAFEDLVDDHLDTVTVGEVEAAVRGWGARERGDEFVTDLWVRPDWQRRGVGSALLSGMIADVRAAGFGRVCLETHMRNQCAVRFYQRHGFKIVSRSWELSTSLGRDIERARLERRI